MNMSILALFFLSTASLLWLPAEIPAASSMERYSLIGKWGSLCGISDLDLSCSIKQTESQFRYPTGVAVSSSGMIYITDSWNDRIQEFTADGNFITKWGSRGSGNGQVRFPTGIVVDSASNVYVTDFGNSRVQKFTADGKFITKWGSEGSDNSEFSRPQGIAVDSASNVYVADSGNERILKFTADGRFITKWGPAVSSQNDINTLYEGVSGIAVEAKYNKVYVTDTWNDNIQVFIPSTE